MLQFPDGSQLCGFKLALFRRWWPKFQRCWWPKRTSAPHLAGYERSFLGYRRAEHCAVVTRSSALSVPRKPYTLPSLSTEEIDLVSMLHKSKILRLELGNQRVVMFSNIHQLGTSLRDVMTSAAPSVLQFPEVCIAYKSICSLVMHTICLNYFGIIKHKSLSYD